MADEPKTVRVWNHSTCQYEYLLLTEQQLLELRSNPNYVIYDQLYLNENRERFIVQVSPHPKG